MNKVVTLIVKQDDHATLERIEGPIISLLGSAGATAIQPDRLGPTALDVRFALQDSEDLHDQLHELLADQPVDWYVQRLATRQKALFIADMDSTMITVECIDELADMIGLKGQVAAITEAAMRGELDFSQALEERVALLKGLDEAVLDQVYQDRIRFSPGARTLIATLNNRGIETVLISGGFTYFTQRVADELGFSQNVANRLDIAEGRLTGTVAHPIVDSATKLATLRTLSADRQLAPHQVIAIGDGANDIPMIEAAGLGLAYHAKPKAQAAADLAINHGDLTAVLYLLGVRNAEFA